jgi:hypothetical protein
MMLHAYLAADPKAKREQFAHQLATAVDLDDARPTAGRQHGERMGCESGLLHCLKRSV